ncbi:MAG: hypothetical protein V2A61_05870 [Calditrichota bacterium]
MNANWYECESILEAGLQDGQEILLNLEDGSLISKEGVLLAQGRGLTPVQRDIYIAGGLLETVQEGK